MTVAELVSALLVREGGYVNHAADRGGPTNYGVTIPALAEYRRRPVTAADVRRLSEGEARALYESKYFTVPNLHRITDAALQSLAFDCAVNHGPAAAIKWLQAAAGVTVDGKFGPRSVAAVNADPRTVYRRTLASRLRLFGRLITHDAERRRATRNGYRLQAVFAAGWLERAASFLD